MTVNGISESIYDSSEHAFTDGDIHDGSSSLHNISLLDFSVEGSRRAEVLPIVTEDDNTNIISFQVEGHTLDA
jgi:hypothetical protein